LAKCEERSACRSSQNDQADQDGLQAIVEAAA
jgi:hypothetical protein